MTGLAWLDPVVAALVALNLMWTGGRLVRHAAGGLLDEEDTALLNRLLEVLDGAWAQGVIRVHQLRGHPLRAAFTTSTRTWWCRSSGRWTGPTSWRRPSPRA